MTHNKPKPRRRWLVLAAGLGWVVALAGGMFWLTRYSMTPGTAAAAVMRWPGTPELELARDRDTFVMFLHPLCPCSDASVEELNRLITRCGERINVLVLIYQPSNQADEWSRTGLWKRAAAIGGVVVRPDRDAALASRFGARTSGQTYLYDTSGRLLFDGGITGSRGHAGDNAGLDAVISLVSRRQEAGSALVHAPTFGCPLGD